MKNLKKIFVLILTLIISFSSLTSIYAKPFSKTSAKVLEIIDGESMRVSLSEGGDTEFVRLIGINSLGDNTAFGYMNSNLLGKTVILSPDDYISGPVQERWLYAYVYLNGKLINEELLKKGYARTDPAYSSITKYASFQRNEKLARDGEHGIWHDYETSPYPTDNTNTPSSFLVNINTASKEKLMSLLYDIDGKLADNIINYRKQRAFTSVSDIKKVSGFSDKIYDRNYKFLTTKTNINSASEKELSTLSDIRQSEISAIIKYRNNKRFTDPYELYSKNLVSNSTYNKIKDFIYAGRYWDNENNNTEIDGRININTATRYQLRDRLSGVTDTIASNIINYRKDKSFKSIVDLKNVKGITDDIYDKNRDILKVITDINSAKLDELITLDLTNSQARDIIDSRDKNKFNYKTELYTRDIISYTKYEEIKDYIEVGNSQTNTYDYLVNINTASRDSLVDLLVDVNYSLADEIVKYRKTSSFNSIHDIKKVNGFTDALFSKNISILATTTNINKANEKELSTLGNLTYSECVAITEARNKQKFKNIDELVEKNIISKKKFDPIEAFLRV